MTWWLVVGLGCMGVTCFALSLGAAASRAERATERVLAEMGVGPNAVEVGGGEAQALLQEPVDADGREAQAPLGHVVAEAGRRDVQASLDDVVPA